MKAKLFAVGLLLLVVVVPSFAAQPYYGIQVGFHNPKAADTGFIIGGTAGSSIDERFDVGLGIDYFRKTYEETTTITDPNGGNGGGVEPTIQVPDFESSVTMIPIMGHVRFKIPMGSDFEAPLTPFVQGEAGYILSWYGYTNYETDEDENQFFGGFGLRFAIGAMYQIGSSSQVSLELTYMSASLSREEEDPEIGRPVKTELDLSGVGVRLGLIFGGFGG